MHTTGRRTFLAAGSLGALSVAAGGYTRAAPDDADDGLIVRAPAERVAEFVGACHARLDDVQAMLAQDPELARAAWDWGFGDWENAIGACSHTGRVDIIEVLLAHGACPDIFTMATLDEVDAVRAFVKRNGDAAAIDGPHGISLFRHAVAGEAARVIEFLTSQGLNDERDRFRTDPATKRFVGFFAWGSAPRQRLELKWVERLSCLSLVCGAEPGRNLAPTEGNGQAARFRPAGSTSATVTFVSDDRVVLQYHARETVADRIG